MLSLVMLLLAADPAHAPAAGTQATGASPTTRDESAASAPVKEQLVCKRVVETGSHVRAQKVCRSAAEWRRIQAEERDAFGDSTSRRRTPDGQ